MASLSTRRKRFYMIVLLSIVVLAIFIIPFLIFSTSETSFSTQFQISSKDPYDYPDSTWISNDPQIVLHVNEAHNIQDATAYLVVDDVIIDVDIFLQSDRYLVRIKEKRNGTILIEGTLSEVKQDMISFTIDSDNVFSNMYSSISLTKCSDEQF